MHRRGGGGDLSNIGEQIQYLLRFHHDFLCPTLLFQRVSMREREREREREKKRERAREGERG